MKEALLYLDTLSIVPFEDSYAINPSKVTIRAAMESAVRATRPFARLRWSERGSGGYWRVIEVNYHSKI